MSIKPMGEAFERLVSEWEGEMEELDKKRADLEKKLQAARVRIDDSIPFIFISYAREDQESAYRIYNHLKYVEGVKHLAGQARSAARRGLGSANKEDHV